MKLGSKTCDYGIECSRQGEEQVPRSQGGHLYVQGSARKPIIWLEGCDRGPVMRKV